MVLAVALFTLCVGIDQAYVHPPTAKEIRLIADSFAESLAKFEKERAAAIDRLDEAKAIRIPSFKPRGTKAIRERGDLERSKRISIRESNEAMMEAQSAMTEMRGTLLPRAAPIISIMSDTAPLGKMGALNAPTRIVQVIDDHTLLISMGEDQTLARLHWPTGGLTDDTSLKTVGQDWFIVVGTYQYATAIGGQRTVLDIKPLDTSPIREEIRKRLKK